MRILEVPHAFMPESMGGTEVHSYLLSKALSDRHDIAIAYRIVDRDRTDHEIITSEYDGLPVYKIVNNFSWSRNADFDYFDPGIEPRLRSIIEQFRPDVIHFHHLGGGLSTSAPALVKNMDIPMILTLHDNWFMCPNSRMLTARDELCPGPEGGLRCAECWLQLAIESRLSVKQRVRELGLKESLRRAPRFILDAFGMREYLHPVSYHTLRLMARDTYMKSVLNQFETIISPSQFLLETYAQWGIPREKLTFVQNGIDPSKFEGMSRERPRQDIIQAVYTGNILHYKGIGLMIDAFNKLVDCPISLRIYGDDKAETVRPYVKALKERCINPRVTFEGRYKNDEVGRVLSQADLVLVPSIWYENCPLTILEAQLARRPVVTSNVGGMAELIQDGVNGRTFRVGDAGHLADTIRSLVEDRAELDRLAANARIPDTMEEVAVKIEAIYERLIADAQASA